MLSEGFFDVPKGCVAAVVTHLEMLEAPQGHGRLPLSEGMRLIRHETPDIRWYLDLYKHIGRDWLWFSRLSQSEETLRKTLHHPLVEVYSLDRNGQSEGMIELDFRQSGACELAFFGLSAALIGQGAGRALMSHAVARAFEKDITRLHLHTCTLDSPQALPFYRRMGFTPIRQEIEIARDPRLAGLLPKDAGPHVPLLP